jgi:transposase
MWCIPTVDAQFIERMEHLLDLYAKPYNSREPVCCFDEQHIQRIGDTRPPVPARPGVLRKRDYEYERHGTANLFVTVEPKGGYRTIRVTQRRTKVDFAWEVRRIAEVIYPKAHRIHLVLDNLNTHFPRSLQETFGSTEAGRILDRITFHYTPKHASWLNMAEIELSVLKRTGLRERTPSRGGLRRAVTTYQRRRNRRKATIRWTFTRADAREVFQEYYKTELR